MLNADEAGRLLKVTPTYIRQLARQGVLPKASRGLFPLVGLVQGYIDFLRSEDRRSSKSAADSRVRDARAAEIELKMAERRRDLIPQEDAQAAVSALCGMFRQTLNGLPARMTRDLELRTKIEKEVDAALATLARRAREIGTALRTGVDALAADEEDDAG